MKFTPMPGIVIIKPEKEEDRLTITNQNNTRLLKGKVVAIGINLVTDMNALLEMDRYTKIGDTVYFLSYEGNYDNVVIDNEKYYSVKVQDLRFSL